MIRSLLNWFNTPEGTYRIKGNRIINMREHRDAILGWSYALVALITFGYNASHYPSCGYGDTPERDTVSTGVKSAVGSALWPAYWVWEAADTMGGRVAVPKC